MWQNTRILSECHYDSTAPILYFSQVWVRTYLTTHVRKKKEEGEHIYTYFHLLFDFIFKQVIAKNLNKAKLGLTLLDFPSEVVISGASLFGDQGYLISF
jgi:hypothetical protein